MEQARLGELLESGGIALPAGAEVSVTGADPVLAARYPIGETAAAALVACGAQAAELWRIRTGRGQSVRADVREAAASLLSFVYMRIEGEGRRRENETNPTVALYECGDGRWIHLHGGFPHQRAGTLDVLGCAHDAEEAAIGAAVRRWTAQALEDALAARGLCGAMVRAAGEWKAHPQGFALENVPAVEVVRIGDAQPEPLRDGDAPLSGVRVLDLTRVLAGPACGRALAQHGAGVLNISSPHLPTAELFDIDTGHGKRAAHLDLDQAGAADTLRSLVAGADVFIDGYRSGALARRGFGPQEAATLRPGIVYVAINCYGHKGPWFERPGWEQLAQSATGIAATQGAPGPPRLVPAAACDYTTGYLAAYGAMAALARRATEGGSWLVRASLCQTAMWIERQGATCDPAAAGGAGDVSDLLIEAPTPFGVVRHLRPPIELPLTPARWSLPTVPRGTHAATWAT